MTLTALQDLKVSSVLEGKPFGDTGAYERMDAIAEYRVDPAHPANAGIVDLNRVARGDDGLVTFSGDLAIIRPVDPGRCNGAAMLLVPNRGHFNGDARLLERGWTLAVCGWQWDVPRDEDRIGLAAPSVAEDQRDLDDHMQLRLQPTGGCTDMALTDHHVGELGNHRPIPPDNMDDATARLLVRDTPLGEAREVPRDDWQFARDDAGAPVADETRVWVRGGFEAGRVYDLIYRPRYCPVVGAGMLALRDCATYLKFDHDYPIDQVVAVGASQCGRLLRTYLHLGLNVDADNRQAMDGILAHVAGGRRGEFNQRYGQPSVQTTPGFGHLFPFADDVQDDPATGKADGLLQRQRQRGGVPKIFYTDTSPEYWRGDASLTHTDLGSGQDVEPPSEVRRYLFASTQHPGAAETLTDVSSIGIRTANTLNIVTYAPLLRAAMVNLLAWIRGTEPPVSVFPRRADASAIDRVDALRKLAALTDLAQPRPEALNHIAPLDLGARAQEGIGRFPPVVTGTPYPCVVSALDRDGNELAGIRSPDVEVPLGVHTGFNPRHPDTGGIGQFADYLGSTQPFSRAEITRRYASRSVYLDRIRRHAEMLSASGYLLDDDVQTCVDSAARSYDLIMDNRDG